jgi:FKBP-type peptidyl-prolyl cis-trans isomerase
MYVGGVRRLTIPAALAYGIEGNGPIPANQALDFEIQVVNAQPASSSISLQYRLGAYAVALTVPLILFSIAWFVLHNL